ncbi:MAG: hypothetical protein BWY28_03241 [bacterium ADurb.Bin236]|nr:MAG: hypothetical protein BWY28_03241 [bacterium ADurb.Bin236]
MPSKLALFGAHALRRLKFHSRAFPERRHPVYPHQLMRKLSFYCHSVSHPVIHRLVGQIRHSPLVDGKFTYAECSRRSRVSVCFGIQISRRIFYGRLFLGGRVAQIAVLFQFVLVVRNSVAGFAVARFRNSLKSESGKLARFAAASAGRLIFHHNPLVYAKRSIECNLAFAVENRVTGAARQLASTYAHLLSARQNVRRFYFVRPRRVASEKHNLFELRRLAVIERAQLKPRNVKRKPKPRDLIILGLFFFAEKVFEPLVILRSIERSAPRTRKGTAHVCVLFDRLNILRIGIQHQLQFNIA